MRLLQLKLLLLVEWQAGYPVYRTSSFIDS